MDDIPILETLEALFAEKKSIYAFETCGDRKCFPHTLPPSRVGIALAPIKGSPFLGPGTYEVEQQTSMITALGKKITSTEGYTLGARKTKRFQMKHGDLTPDPTHYQTKFCEEKTFQENYRPFLQSSQRFPVKRGDIYITPGIGAYEHDRKSNKQVKWHQSFGGPPIDLPSVQQKSTILRNTDKLLSTKEDKKYQRRLAYLKLYY